MHQYYLHSSMSLKAWSRRVGVSIAMPHMAQQLVARVTTRHSFALLNMVLGLVLPYSLMILICLSVTRTL